MSTQTSSPSVPSIRSFQFDANAAGGVRDSVNLFRGDVNLKQSLFTMPGRQSDGLDVEVSLLYQSNVYSQAMTFNRQAPTSVVGLGWTFPLESIELQVESGSSPAAPAYALISNGGSNPLIREPAQPYLFALTQSEAGNPVAGQVVPSALVAAFGQRGLAVASTATLAAESDGALRIVDDEQQREFLLVPRDGAWAAFDGGQAYQLQQYQFWKILYYSTWERWVIVDDSGLVSSYGGIATPGVGGFAASVGNSIEWAVAWTSASGAIQWSGASSQPNGQRQVARAWHLASKTNTWGDRVAYAYNEQWAPDPGTGVRPVVEQLVCKGGEPYTKACYLTSITDVFGKRASFEYADKLWSSESGQPREYDDPHKATPDDQPNGWQDRYETQYLQTIVVSDSEGGRLFGVDFTYDPRPRQGSASAVANVNPNPPNGDPGDFYKRYLTAIAFSDEFGAEQPAIRFHYWLEATEDPGYSPGALASSTSPTGGTSRWRYTEQQLDLCARELDIAPPSGFGSTVVPRLWFSSDYAVTMWFDLLGNQVSLAIHTWQGRWDTWVPSWGAILATESAGIELDTLAVIPSSDFVVISYVAGQQRKVWVFDKDSSTTGNWLPSTIADTTCGQDAPNLSYSTSYGAANLFAGDSFLLVGYASDLQKYAYDRLTWRWTTREWSLETFALGGLTQFVAHGEYYLKLGLDRGYQLSWLDATLAWQTGGSGTLSYFSDPSKAVLVPGSSLVAVGQLLSSGSTSLSYALAIVQWDAAYQTTATSIVESDSTAISWIPQVVDDTMVAVGGRLWRFDGASWQLNQALVIASPTQGWTQRFAYGPDYAIQLQVNGQNQVTTDGARLLAYDASASGSWATTQAVASTASFGTSDVWPSAGSADYLTMGSYLYYRGSASDWGQVVSAGAPQNLAELIPDAEVLDTSATVNQGPTFLAFNSKNSSTGAWTATAAFVLGNGLAVAETDVGEGMRMVCSTDPDFGKPGVAPAGPATLVVFPNTCTSFSAAPRYTLYRCVGNELDGKIRHFGVSSFETDDGFGNPIATAILLDPSTAACDPSGTWIKYYASLVAPGVATVELDDETSLPAAGTAPFGFVAVHYLNGVEEVVGSDRAASMLDGMLIGIDTHDDQAELLSSVALTWQPYQSIAPEASDPSVPARFLRGGFAAQTGGTLVADGVTSSRASTYVAEGFDAPFSTQPITSASSGIGSSGVLETRTTGNRFAIQLDDAITTGVFRALNLRGGVVETRSEWQRAGESSLTTSASASTWTSWGSQLGEGVVVPAKQASFAWLGNPSELAFPFSSPNPIGTVTGWQRQSTIGARTVHGLIAEGSDAMSVPSSAIYDASGTLPVAGLQNGSIDHGEWAFLGFEPYEVRSGWTITSGREVAGDAYFGGQSLALASGGSLRTSVDVHEGVSGYVVGFAIKTPAGFQPASGTAWTASYSGGGTAPAPVAITSTEGAWEFRSIGLPFAGGQQPTTITIALSNANDVEILVDCVYVIPLGSNFSAQCYDTRYNQVIAGMTMNGFVTRTLYDDSRRAVAAVDGHGLLRQAGGQALSRANSAHGWFSRSAPNNTLKVVFADAGTCDDFHHGDEWLNRWTPSDASAWTRAPGLLSTNSGGTLTWAGDVGGSRSAALTVGIQLAKGQPTSPITIGFADDHTIAWQPGVGWTASGSGWSPTAVVQPPTMAGDWLLVFGTGRLAFFAGNQLIFSTPWTLGVPSDLRLIAAGPLALRHIGVGGGPRVTVSYADGNGKPLQGQTLDGDDASVSATITDPLGRTLATTKFAPASFEMPTDEMILGYLDAFVDRQAFLAATADTWLLTGTVADYYRGETIDGFTPSDDGGYPYTGTRYRAVPKGRKLETGLPGAATAIHDVDQPPSTRQTTWFEYGCNPAIELDGVAIAAGSYYEQVATGPRGNATRRWRAFDRTQVAAELIAPTSEILGETRSLQAWLEQHDHVVGESRGITPNQLVNEQYSNALGEPTLTQTAGQAASWTLRDAAGRIRVAGFGESQVVAYFVYDALGRPLEFGRIAVDPAGLSDHTGDPSWPLDDTSRTITRSFVYDGEGDTPTSLGLRTRVTTTTSAATTIAPSATPISVSESYVYDGRGRIASVTQSIDDEPSLPSATFRYEYDNADEVVRVVYPSGSPIAEVDYAYDDNGRVITIGTRPGADDLARYDYAPNGDLIREILGGGTLTLASSYTSQGWLATYAANLADASPFWTQSYVYYPDSTIASRTDTTAAPLSSGVSELSFGYDGCKQLASASSTGATAWTESLTSVDANGNILAAELDGVTMQAVRDPASNEIQTVQVGSGPIQTVGYDPLGNLISVGGTTTQYDPLLLVPSGFSGSGGTAVLGYGGANQRVLKRTIATQPSTRLSFGGMASRPLAQWQDGTWSAAVQGPTGLIAVVSDRKYFPIKDLLQSVRHWVDDGGTVIASFAYSAFGSLVAQSGEIDDALPRFMGQIQDVETGCYAFPARLYDPVLRRFHGPDPAHQYPSPYVFVGNQPISNSDPTGEMAWYGLIAMSAVFAVGFGLSLCTGGASAEAAADIDALLLTADLGESSADVVDTTVVGKQTQKVVKDSSKALEDIEGESEPIDVGPGESSDSPISGDPEPQPEAAPSEAPSEGQGAAKAASGSTTRRNLRNIGRTAQHVGMRTLGGAIMGGAENGALYLLEHPNSYDQGQFMKAFLLGMLEGAISGSVASLVDMPLSKGLMRKYVSTSAIKQSAMVVAGKGVVGMGTSDVNYLITDACEGKQPSLLGMVGEAAWGLVAGAGASALGEGFNLAPTRVQLVVASAGTSIAVGVEATLLQQGIKQSIQS
jgi:RHS repeat-associated protein